jgi:hypothetical protein
MASSRGVSTSNLCVGEEGFSKIIYQWPTNSGTGTVNEDANRYTMDNTVFHKVWENCLTCQVLNTQVILNELENYIV